MLSPEAQQELHKIGPTDIMIGLPSYNNAQTIGPVLEALRLGLAKDFPSDRVVLVNSDGGSTDETPALIAGVGWDAERVLTHHAAPPAERVAVPFHGIPGRAAAQWTLLEAARTLEARACLLIGPDSLGIAPDWVDRLLGPVLEEECDYVAPLYQRHRYEGTLTYGLIYPLIRALYGKRIRHPLGGQNGLSGRLVVRLAGEGIRGDEVTRQGLDLWITATAVAERFSVCEAWLGSGRVESRSRTIDLGTTFTQAVGSAFALLERTAEVWPDIQGSEPVPAIGTLLPLGVEAVELNVGRMSRALRLGLKDLLPLWEQVLAPDTLGEVLALESRLDETFSFPHDLWARVVYDFALGYHFQVIYRDHLLRSLVPLYLGRTAAFVRETMAGGALETETWIERSCRAFEQQKAYLVARWQ